MELAIFIIFIFKSQQLSCKVKEQSCQQSGSFAVLSAGSCQLHPTFSLFIYLSGLPGGHIMNLMAKKSFSAADEKTTNVTSAHITKYIFSFMPFDMRLFFSVFFLLQLLNFMICASLFISSPIRTSNVLYQNYSVPPPSLHICSF